MRSSAPPSVLTVSREAAPTPAPAASATPVPIDKVLPDVTDVGHDDVVDWKRIFAKSKEAGIEHYFVEHDNPSDGFASIKKSFDFLHALNY